VYRGDNETDASKVLTVISFWQQLLSAPANDPALIVDMDLRPEGKQGPVARSLDSYAAYYERWALTWESQAMLRARAVAGSVSLGRDFIALIDPLRYPAEGLDETQLREIRRIKARVESERLPRGANPLNHVKLGPGGISDVEWTAQLLQLNHAGRIPELQTISTLEALAVAESHGLLEAAEREQLVAAWLMASDIRNGITLTAEKPSDSIPSDQAALRLLSFVLHQSSGAQLLETYRRCARRARQVMQKYVYGQIEEDKDF
jgi:glutamate-ammonia-ligase adenylyltransferase